ncbi:MAG: C69 family dipeptidase, partial [Synergistaceae bacterium]|nr:C69 family dipeptidase [Synergistaceae bacterium]
MKMIPLVPLSKRFLALSALFFYLAAPTASWACSSVVVGKDASATGNVLLSRTEDVRPGIAARFVVYPRGYYKKGVPVKMDRNGFAFTFSHDSYKFTGTPMTTYSSVMMAKGSDETVTPNTNEDGVNEHGLAVSATNTTAFAQEIGGEGGLDPMPDSNA